MNGRTASRPYPTQDVVAEIVRVGLHDAKPRERDAALAPLRTLWKLVTGDGLDLSQAERHAPASDFEIAAEDAKKLLMAAAGAQRRAEERATAVEVTLLESLERVKALTAQIREFEAATVLYAQRAVELELHIRQAGEEQDAERRAARAAQDRLTRENQELTRRNERDRMLADARAERIARLVASGIAVGKPIDWTVLSRVGLHLDIFHLADRNHQAICAYLQIRWQIIRHHKEAPTPLPMGVDREMLELAYRGHGALLPWPQLASVVESIGGQSSFLEHLYNAAKAQEALDAKVIAIMGQPESTGPAEDLGPTETTSADRPRRNGPHRRLLGLVRQAAPAPSRLSRRENATQRHLYL
ncbi:hypothetical protein ACFQ1L_21360 [Phytohabitans flavus]